MGLLDSVLGAALGGQQPGAQAVPQAGGQGALLGALVGMLSQNSGGLGGLGGLIAKFEQGGLGDVAASWVGGGANQPVSPDQVSSALGNDTIGQLAQHLGLGHGEVASQLSQLLPGLVDKLTPHGAVPQDGGAGGLGDLAATMLGGLLKK